MNTYNIINYKWYSYETVTYWHIMLIILYIVGTVFFGYNPISDTISAKGVVVLWRETSAWCFYNRIFKFLSYNNNLCAITILLIQYLEINVEISYWYFNASFRYSCFINNVIMLFYCKEQFNDKFNPSPCFFPDREIPGL